MSLQLSVQHCGYREEGWFLSVRVTQSLGPGFKSSPERSLSLFTARPGMAFTKIRTRENYTPPKRICLVDKDENAKILYPELEIELQKAALPVVKYEPNNNSPLKESTIYVLSDFEHEEVIHGLEKIPNSYILGPVAAVEMCKDHNKALGSKPMFCTSMYGLCCYVECPDSLKRRMAKLIKWMGGMFTREPNYNTTHMITTSVLSKAYTYCYTFGVPVMSPEWVEVCWSRRHEVDFKSTSIIDDYKLKPFTGLGINFQGFEPNLLCDMLEITLKNGGVVCDFEDPDCTHMVFCEERADLASFDIPAHIQYIVKERWFWTSLDEKERVYEEFYSCFTCTTIEDTAWAKQCVKAESKGENDLHLSSEQSEVEIIDLTHSPSIRTSIKHINEDVVLSKEEKRKKIFNELVQTEKNYINHLNKLLEVQLLCILEDLPGGSALNQTESKLIFGNLEDILEIHRKIIKELETTIKNWDTDINKGQAYTKFEKELMKEYVTFAKDFTVSDTTFKHCEKNNLKFQELLRYFKEQPKSENVKDLFIRPIQRLPSTSLLLKEIRKHTTPIHSQDIDSLSAAINTIDNILKMMNDDKEKVEKQQEMFNIYRQIESCPPYLITSSREFVTQFLTQEIINKENALGIQLMFFLFNDVLEVAKVRSSRFVFSKLGESTGTNEKKPFRHIAMIPLSAIKNILAFEKHSDCNKDIFGFNIVDEKTKKKYVHCFLYLEKSLEYENALYMMEQQLKNRVKSVLTDSPESEKIILRNIPTKRLSIDPIYLKKGPN